MSTREGGIRPADALMTQLAHEWRHLSPGWIQEVREGRNPARKGLLDQPMLEACGDVRGLRVLDSGCGEGRFCRLLVDCGAREAVGVDLCGHMIEAAQALQSGNDAYVLADVQNLGFLADGRFDLAVSYLNQCDLPDFESNTREIFRVLRPGGRFIICNVHPMRSATGIWQRAADGSKQHVILDHYFAEGERRFNMLNIEFTNFHRSLSTYIRGYRRAGFAIDDVVEPTVNARNLAAYPELDDELRVPNFIIFILRKPF